MIRWHMGADRKGLFFFMTRTLISETISKIGETVLIKGWVNTRRDHGKIVFIDLRDRTGLLQVVLSPELAGSLHSEDVVYITGKNSS